jgi:tRNA (cytidine/uridine-2'-O-)-methyltransferase
MKHGHPHIVLYRPEIPQNTGNIGRLAAGSGSRLHLITPFGFEPQDKNLRRAGLDYWPYLDLEIHDDIRPLLKNFRGRLALFSKKAHKSYWEMPDHADVFIFGQETKGLPDWVTDEWGEHLYRIPMYHPDVRSHNLANAVSIIVYHRIAKIHDQNPYDQHHQRPESHSPSRPSP